MSDDFSLEFRDGKRQVAPHVYEMLSGIETYRYTYEEAMKVANNRLFSTHVENKHASFIKRHFKENAN